MLNLYFSAKKTETHADETENLDQVGKPSRGNTVGPTLLVFMH